MNAEKGHAGFRQGIHRGFFLTQLTRQTASAAKLTKIDHLYLFVLLALGVAVRLYKIPWPAKVIFDEVHFGGFAREYFHGDFFVDVHPPLAKLSYFWIAQAFGWNGNFEFANIGDEYDENVPYVPMRLFSAFCGVLTILLAYGTLRSSGCRSIVALFGAFLVLVENLLVTQSRYILLDGPLLLGLAVATFAFQRFQKTEPFSKKWFKHLFLTGWGLGLATSVKLTGLYTVAWVGLFTLYQLWQLLGDLDVTPAQLARHLVFRIAGLIVLPITIYLGLFSVHFVSLPFNGSGAGIMTPSFKATLEDSDALVNQPVEISYGSTITIKHNNLEGYLHSHDHMYLSGSFGQQVTQYGFGPDENNEWIIETKNKNREGYLQQKFNPVKDGDTVKLFHKNTGHYLYVHDLRPPVSEHDYANEVSCNGTREDLGDINFEWKVRILSKKDHSVNDLPLIKLRATESIFQLIHRGTGCVLMSHKDKLPDWGFGQNEVLCVEEPTIANTLWYIEANLHPIMDNDTATYPRVHFKELTFLDKVVAYHRAMLRVNSGLTEDHSYALRPETWPLLARGINFYSTSEHPKVLGESGSHVYFLGNMAVYYVGFAVCLIVLMKVSFYVFRQLNPFEVVIEASHASTFYTAGMQYAVGWFLQYAPAFQMSRQLFLHHYLTAVYFAVLTLSQYTEYQTAKRPIVGYIIMVAMASWAFYCYWTFRPVIYGLEWTFDECMAARWISTWDLDCVAYR